MANKYSREELSVMIEKELSQAIGAPGSEIANIRKRNLEYYQAEAVGELAPPDVPDRSSIVATDVADTIESILPSLIRTFAASQDAVECEAKTPQMQPQAKMASEYLRHIFWSRCDGFNIVHSWFKDALIQKVGFVKVSWDKEPEETEQSYRGLTPQQAQGLLSQPNVEPVSKDERTEVIGGQQVVLYDLTIKQTLSKGRCKVVAVPPEEMRVHPRARYGEEPLFVAHVRTDTRGALEAEGYDLSGVGSGDDSWSMEERTRSLFNNHGWSDDTGEHERFRVAECYIKLDQDSDGLPEWRRILMVGDTVMEDDKMEEHPFAFFCPIPQSHTFFGLCPADQAIEPQRLNTSLMRAMLDNTYLTVNQRTGIIEGQVNLDDLMTSRPGGVVRMKNAQAMAPIVQPPLPQSAWQMVEWSDAWRERRTGFTRYSQGLKADALSPQTAYGASLIAEKDDMRMELMARVAAESMRCMFEKLLRCMARYQDVADVVQLFGQWTEVDPRVWQEGFQIRVNVGLGLGNKDKRAATLGQIIQMQQPMIGAGMIDPSGAVLAAQKFAEASGLTDSQQYFPPAQPKEPQPDPRLQFEQAKAQAEMQAEQQKTQAQMQMEQQRMQMQAEVDTNRQAAEQAQQQAKMQSQMELERFKAQLMSELELQKSQIQQQTQLAIARINAEARIDAAQLSAQTVLSQQQEQASDEAAQ